MAELSQMGVPGASAGILHPIMTYRFRVRFTNEAGEELPFGSGLTQQVVSFSGHNQNQHSTSSIFSIIFEDDVTNVAMKAAQSLNKIPSFSVHLDVLDGCETVLRTTTYKQATIESLEHSQFDYGSKVNSSDLILSGTIPQKVGPVIDAIKENPVTGAIFAALSGSNFAIEVGRQTSRAATARILACFSYCDHEMTFK